MAFIIANVLDASALGQVSKQREADLLGLLDRLW